jgi:hypothetical protein
VSVLPDRQAGSAVSWRRVATVVAIVVAGVALAVEVAIGVSVIGGAGDIGVDYRFYRDAAQRWLTEGSFYLPHQLAGPYVVTTLVDVLYPPNALLLFVPFVALPAVLWWAIPIGVLGAVIATWRPALWSIPVMLVMLMWVRAFGAFLWGNTDMWMAAAIAGGLRWGWPAALILIKPSIAPFVLAGARRRSFWVVAVAFVVASLVLFWPLWLDYVQVVRNMGSRPDYALGSVSLLLVPVVAWIARRRTIEAPPARGPSRPSSPANPALPAAH